MRELNKRLFTMFLAGAFAVAGLALAPASDSGVKGDGVSKCRMTGCGTSMVVGNR